MHRIAIGLKEDVVFVVRTFQCIAVSKTVVGYEVGPETVVGEEEGRICLELILVTIHTIDVLQLAPNVGHAA